jgi:hypothetical protein
MSIEGFKVYNIRRKVNGAFVTSCRTQKHCHQYMKIMKEEHFFNTGSMETAEEQFGENSYYIEYGFALIQSCVASYYEGFSDWP